MKWVVVFRHKNGKLIPGVAKLLNPGAEPHKYEFEFLAVELQSADSARELVDRMNRLERETDGKQRIY